MSSTHLISSRPVSMQVDSTPKNGRGNTVLGRGKVSRTLFDLKRTLEVFRTIFEMNKEDLQSKLESGSFTPKEARSSIELGLILGTAIWSAFLTAIACSIVVMITVGAAPLWAPACAAIGFAAFCCSLVGFVYHGVCAHNTVRDFEHRQCEQESTMVTPPSAPVEESGSLLV